MMASEVIEKVENAIKEDKTVSPALIAAIQMMLSLVRMLLGRSKLTSKNSSKPPSYDGNNEADDEKDKNISKIGLKTGVNQEVFWSFL